MTRLILHIGVAKTGTTAIQAFLSFNRVALEKSGVWYPDPRKFSRGGDEMGHNALAYQLCDRRETVDLKRFREALVRKEQDSAAVVLSAEVFVDQEYAFLADYLSDLSSPIILEIGAHISTFAQWGFLCCSQCSHCQCRGGSEHLGALERNIAAISSSSKFAGWPAIHAAAHATDGETIRLSEDGPSMSHRVSANERANG